MSHIYQPVMLLELLTSKGAASINQIAKALLSHDASQIEYYEQITKNMVGRVLTKNRQITAREGDGFRLRNFEALTSDEVSVLVALCQTKIDEYVGRRGEAIWAHRRKSSGYVPGTARYDILKRARFRCELCGISADEKALEVDHILPRNLGGSDEEHVRRQNIWHNSRRKLAEFGLRLGVDVRRRACGVASADARWSVA